MDMLEEAARYLERERVKELAIPVIYERRKGGTFTVNATLGRTIFRAENDYGIVVDVVSRDFLVAASELPLEPERGDMVIYNGMGFEVLAPGGEPVWRWSGRRSLVRRIHTKEIGRVKL